jgi:hypothetical protein
VAHRCEAGAELGEEATAEGVLALWALQLDRADALVLAFEDVDRDYAYARASHVKVAENTMEKRSCWRGERCARYGGLKGFLGELQGACRFESTLGLASYIQQRQR